MFFNEIGLFVLKLQVSHFMVFMLLFLRAKIAFFISKHFHNREFNFQTVFVQSTAVEMFAENRESSRFDALFLAGQM